MLDYFNDDACLVGVRIYFRNYGYHGTFIYIKHPMMMMMICDFLKTSDVKLERHPRLSFACLPNQPRLRRTLCLLR